MVRNHSEGFEKEDVRLSLNPIMYQLCVFEGVAMYLICTWYLIVCKIRYWWPLLHYSVIVRIGKYLWMSSEVYKNEEQYDF